MKISTNMHMSILVRSMSMSTSMMVSISTDINAAINAESISLKFYSEEETLAIDPRANGKESKPGLFLNGNRQILFGFVQQT